MDDKKSIQGRRYLTPKELAKRWAVSENTLRNMRYEGKPPRYIKGVPGVRCAYLLEDIEQHERNIIEEGQERYENYIRKQQED